VGALAALDHRLVQLWKPPPRLQLSAWADQKFRLPEWDPNAGRWKCLPYQRGILDAISDHHNERITWMKSKRVGYTKCFCAAIGYYIEHDPAPILVVQPTIDDAQKHSKEDIAPMLRDIPILRQLVAEPRTRDTSNTILNKEFRGGSLMIIGANSARGFRRTSRRIVIFDEVDGYPTSAGTEGDPIELGIGRTEYYHNRKILAGSTPDLAGYSVIERLFAEGDQRRRYLPCPHCGAFQTLKFPNLKWPEGKPQLAVLQCEANGCTIEHRHKRAMDEAGEWRAEAPGNFTEHNRHASFHLWAGYSYSPNATWAHLAVEHVRAVRGGPMTLKVFVNQTLGETWQDRGEAPAWEPLMRRRERYAIGTVPRGALLLTAGVDVQKDRVVVEVVGWGRGKTSWSIDYLMLLGDTADLDKGPWSQLDALLTRQFPHANGQTHLTITTLAVDSGYATQTVYGWARKHPRQRVVAIKGMGGATGPLVGGPTAIEYNTRGKRIRRGYLVWPVCGGTGKTELYGWLRLEAPPDGTIPPPGYCHFPEYGEEYFRELTAEQLVPTKTRKGFVRMEWSLIAGRRNDVLDARIYARVAAALVPGGGLDRFSEREWKALERSVDPDPLRPASPVVAEPEPEPERPAPPPFLRPPSPTPRPWLGPRRGSWFRR
jgi:phage terminase large subunit GpA-like protein